MKKNGPRLKAFAISQDIDFGHVVDAHGLESEARENLHEIIRWHNDCVSQAHPAARQGPVRQMIFGAAVVIVENRSLSKQPPEQQSGRGGEIERKIAGRENVQYVGTADIRGKPREIKNESNYRSHILHAQRGVQLGIDREKFNSNRGLICQALQQLIRLNGLTADDVE